ITLGGVCARASFGGIGMGTRFGLTTTPGRTRWSALMITRSFVPRPLVTTCNPFLPAQLHGPADNLVLGVENVDELHVLVRSNGPLSDQERLVRVADRHADANEHTGG